MIIIKTVSLDAELAQWMTQQAVAANVSTSSWVGELLGRLRAEANAAADAEETLKPEAGNYYGDTTPAGRAGALLCTSVDDARCTLQSMRADDAGRQIVTLMLQGAERDGKKTKAAMACAWLKRSAKAKESLS